MSTTYLIHRVRTLFALFALALFNFLLVACGSLVSGSTTTVPTSHSHANVTTTPILNSNLLAILPKMQKSLQAMQQVQTVHVVIQGKGTIQTSGTLLPAFARQTRHKTQ
jgi:hypothetical protein